MKVTVVVPVWKRSALAQFCLSYWSTWNVPDIDFAFVVVRSPGDLCKGVIPRDERFRTAWSRNHPLGTKFNEGVGAATTERPDYVMVMGSDVLVRDTIFADYLPHMQRGEPFIGCLDTYIYDAVESRAYFWPGYRGERAGQVIGPGRLYSRSLLDAIRWAPYPADMDKNLDGGADIHLPEPVGITGRPHDMCSIKTTEQITPVRNYLRSGAYEVPTAELYYEGADFTTL